MDRMTEVSFGDRVRIRPAPATEAIGLAGKFGMVYGSTTPSDTGVHVIGGAPQDRALAVQPDGGPETLWFNPDLVEFVDHAPGTTVRIGSKRLTRDENGNWIENH
jgi:hypothetical protein